MKKVLTDAFTERNNATFDILRMLGALSVLVVGGVAFAGLAPLEAGLGLGAVLTAVAGGIRLKGEEKESVDDAPE